MELNDLNRILCPVDFSEISEMAVRYAISFGERFGIKPQILHVSTKPPDVYYRFYPDVQGYMKVLEKDTKHQLKEFVQKIDAHLKSSIRYGTVYHEIIQFAQDENIDLIIIAAGGYSSSSEQILGTVAQNIIRKAKCPVLTVYGRRIKPDIKKILCPLDLSPRSYQGLLQAAALARKFSSKLYLLHVIELLELKKNDVKKSFSKLSQSLKEEIKIPEEMQDLSIEKIIRRNLDAAAEIVDFASANNIDLITLTTHGRGYLPRVLLGSVAEKVARIAPCPVLSVRVKRRRIK